MDFKFQWSRFLPTPLVLNCATLGPLAYWSKAPGTLGSVAGLLFYTTFFHQLNFSPADQFQFVFVIGIFCFLAMVICGEAEERLMKRDPGEVILDEFVAVPICFLFLGDVFEALNTWSWVLLLAGFLLFRLFDIVKPLGIKKLQDLPGGVGVVVDDLAAAAATCVCLHVGAFVISRYFY